MAMTWWPSPAKINLFLHINGRRENGYHELQTVFQLLSFGDELAFEAVDEDLSFMDQPLEGVEDKDNLILRAIAALRPYSSVKNEWRVHIKKRIPMGGGLGGGSSNAATALRVVNNLWQCNLSTDELCEVGSSLGADVPVFVHGKSCFAEGVGDEFYSMDTEDAWFLVVSPGVHVSTQSVFNHPELPRNTAKIDPEDYAFGATRNDCQQIVCAQYPEVAKLLQWLLQFAPSRMTGTGACVFSVFQTQQQASSIQAVLPNGWVSFVARSTPVSTLLSALQ